MSHIWALIGAEDSTGSLLPIEYVAMNRIGCAALNCIEVNPAEDRLLAFERLVSLFCVVTENTPLLKEILEISGEDTGQLPQTTSALIDLFDVTAATSHFSEDELGLRIATYVDAATKIHGMLPADGNPVVEIL
jgi:hypothetical protein